MPLAPALGARAHGGPLNGNLSLAQRIEVDANRSVGRPLFMHLHMPKTAGSHSIDILLNALCDNSVNIAWKLDPTRTLSCVSTSYLKCPKTLLDTSVSCLDKPRGYFHDDFQMLQPRAATLGAKYHATSIIWITTLRPAVERVVSHWRHFERNCPADRGGSHTGYCSSPLGLYERPRHLGTNESLLQFVRAAQDAHHSNLQVRMLLPPGTPKRGAIGVAELRKVQALLADEATAANGTGRRSDWVVGFAGCDYRMQPRLASLNTVGGAAWQAAPSMPPVPPRRALSTAHSASDTLHFASSVLQIALEANMLDDSLYKWARERSRLDPERFRGCTEAEERAAYHYTQSAPSQRRHRR